jgi:HAE1 family hydrophobic/amphiphilic exporter-1
LEYGNYELVVRTPGEFTSLEQLRDTVVALREGVPVRLGDIAEIEDGWEKITQLVRFNGEPGIRLAVNKQSGKNTVAVAREVLREVARLNAEIPQLRIVPLINTADYIERSIANVGRSAVLGGIYAILVLLFFSAHTQYCDYRDRDSHFHHRHVHADLFRRIHLEPDDAGRTRAGRGHAGGQLDRGS